MVTFQQDFLNIIKHSNNIYLDKIEKLLSNNDILDDLTLEDAENLIEYIKEYNNKINSVIFVIDKINNIKKIKTVQDKIDNELFEKILPIITVYRTLLCEKYRNELNINNVD